MMTNCPDCHNEVSAEAEACPKCGCTRLEPKMRKKLRKWAIITLIFGVLGLVSCFNMTPSFVDESTGYHSTVTNVVVGSVELGVGVFLAIPVVISIACALVVIAAKPKRSVAAALALTGALVCFLEFVLYLAIGSISQVGMVMTFSSFGLLILTISQLIMFASARKLPK